MTPAKTPHVSHHARRVAPSPPPPDYVPPQPPRPVPWYEEQQTRDWQGHSVTEDRRA